MVLVQHSPIAIDTSSSMSDVFKVLGRDVKVMAASEGCSISEAGLK